MTIDWTSFTPVSAACGGVLIGIAVAMLLLLNGRVAGVSGIIGGLLQPQRGDRAWRLAFVGGLLAAPLVYTFAYTAPVIDIDASYGTLAVAGLLVGFGTRLGSGCTSGHGICGMSRLSPRSIVATMAFMAAGFATVFVVRHLLA
jgi:uncharacterized membrane protein YedE/YeeE